MSEASVSRNPALVRAVDRYKRHLSAPSSVNVQLTMSEESFSGYDSSSYPSIEGPLYLTFGGQHLCSPFEGCDKVHTIHESLHFMGQALIVDPKLLERVYGFLVAHYEEGSLNLSRYQTCATILSLLSRFAATSDLAQEELRDILADLETDVYKTLKNFQKALLENPSALISWHDYLRCRLALLQHWNCPIGVAAAEDTPSQEMILTRWRESTDTSEYVDLHLSSSGGKSITIQILWTDVVFSAREVFTFPGFDEDDLRLHSFKVVAEVVAQNAERN